MIQKTMSEKKLLILLTNYYPYYKGEEYIENEICVAAGRFDDIIIIPTMATKSMPLTRVIPNNASVIKMNLDYSLLGRVKMIIVGIPKAFGTGRMKQDKGLTLKQTLYSLYYKARTEFVYSSLVGNTLFSKKINQYKPADVYIYSYWLHITASLAVRIKERVFYNLAKCWSRGHRYDLYDYAAPCNHIPDRRYMFERIDGVYSCSNDGAAYLKQHFSKYDKKISVSRLGTLDHGITRCERESCFHIVSCSAIREVKRLDRIIDVMLILLKKGYQARWTHLGDGPYMENIKLLAEKTLPKDSYYFMGRLDNSSLFKWYKSHKLSCFVNLSDSEGVPVAIMEAMSCGIPIIATDVGGTREIVENERNGYVVSSNWSNEEIASTVERMITLPENEYKEVCKMSRKIWETKCNAEILYEQFYNSILCNQSGE